MPIKVAIIDDETAFRDYVMALVNGTPDLHPFGSFPSIDKALQSLGAISVDVLLLDLNLAGQCALDRLAELRAKLNETRIVVLTTHADNELIFRSLKLGADGYLHKDATDAAPLLDAIRQAAKGESPISGGIARKIIDHFKLETPQEEDRLSELTDRERECLEALAEGATNKEIAEGLGVKEGTVRVHVHNVLKKLHARNRVEAGRAFWKMRG